MSHSSTLREVYIAYLEDTYGVTKLRAELAIAEQCVATDLQDHDIRRAAERQQVLEEISDSLKKVL